jgi:hypothetical protein
VEILPILLCVFNLIYHLTTEEDIGEKPLNSPEKGHLTVTYLRQTIKTEYGQTNA